MTTHYKKSSYAGQQCATVLLIRVRYEGSMDLPYRSIGRLLCKQPPLSRWVDQDFVPVSTPKITHYVPRRAYADLIEISKVQHIVPPSWVRLQYYIPIRVSQATEQLSTQNGKKYMIRNTSPPRHPWENLCVIESLNITRDHFRGRTRGFYCTFPRMRRSGPPDRTPWTGSVDHFHLERYDV